MSCQRTAGTRMRADAGGTRTGVTVRPRPHGSSLRRRETVPWPIPGPWQERPCAGRSPGSRVVARCAAFPDRVDPVAASSKGSQRISLTAYSCRDSRGFGWSPIRTAFPFKPLAGHRRDHSDADFSRRPSAPLRSIGGVANGDRDNALRALLLWKNEPIPCQAVPIHAAGTGNVTAPCQTTLAIAPARWATIA